MLSIDLKIQFIEKINISHKLQKLTTKHEDYTKYVADCCQLFKQEQKQIPESE